MAMTGTEIALLTSLTGVICGFGGAVLGGMRKVSISMCTLKHDELNKLMVAQLGPIREDISEIKKAIQNGRAKP